MQRSKPLAPVAYLFIFLALSIFQITPQETHSKQTVDLPAVYISPTPPVLPAQTGRGEVLEAIVPIQRQTRRSIEKSAQAETNQSDMLATAEGWELPPAFQKFIDEVSDGQAAVVRGVYVPGVFSLPVVQQPAKNSAYVSEENGTITQFQSADHYGITGLLAHNYLTGELFYNLEIGQEVFIVMGDGATRRYQLTGIYRFKKLSPNNLRSNLVDLAEGKTLTTSQVFSRFYRGDHKVTFQTCLEGEGILNWGLTFFVAEPVND